MTEKIDELEGIAQRLKETRTELEKNIEELNKKRRQLDEYLEEREIMRRFAELRGKTFKDESSEMRAEIDELTAALNGTLNNESSLTKDFLEGLIVTPIPIVEKPEPNAEGLFFAFEGEAQYPDFVKEIAYLLDYNIPITVNDVIFTPEGIHVLKEKDTKVAIKQILNATEKLKTNARAFIESLSKLSEICKRIRDSKRWRAIFELLLECDHTLSIKEAEKRLDWNSKTVRTALSQLTTHFKPPLAKRVEEGKYELSKYGQIVAKKYRQEYSIPAIQEKVTENVRCKGKKLTNYMLP